MAAELMLLLDHDMVRFNLSRVLLVGSDKAFEVFSLAVSVAVSVGKVPWISHIPLKGKDVSG